MKETNLPEKVEAFGVKVDNSAKPAIPQPQTARRPNIRRLRPKTALKVLLAIDALFITMSATAELVRYSFYVRQQPVPQQIRDRARFLGLLGQHPKARLIQPRHPTAGHQLHASD